MSLISSGQKDRYGRCSSQKDRYGRCSGKIHDLITFILSNFILYETRKKIEFFCLFFNTSFEKLFVVAKCN